MRVESGPVVVSARVRGRSAKSGVGGASVVVWYAHVRDVRRAQRVRHACLLFCACAAGEKGDQLQCACVGVWFSLARGHRQKKIETHIIL